ncbi:MAG: TonB-dependent receptor [Pseudomonadota bacterium]
MRVAGLSAALAAAQIFWIAPASAMSDAADAMANDDADEIVVTGTRSERALDAEPYSIEVINREQLERELPRTVPEALDTLPGVLVQKTASGHGSPYIRGFTGNRTLLVIDGIRYNNATYRDGANEYFAQIDNFTLSQIELIAGPSSALYGSEAVGGTLSLATRSSGIFDHQGSFINGQQILRASTGDGSFVSRSALDLGQGGSWGLRGGVTVRDYGNVRAADLGRLPNTGYSERAFDARLDVALSHRWTATLAHQSLWQDDVPRTHSTIFSVPFAGTQIGTDLQRDKDHQRGLTYLKLNGDTDLDWMQSLDVTVSYQSRTEEEARIRGDALRIDESFTSDLFGLSAVGSAEFGSVALTYGFDFSHEIIDSARTDTNPDGSVTVRLQGPVGTDARYDQAGLFLRSITSVTEGLTLEAGLRASFVDTSIGQFADPVTDQARSFSDDWSDLSGSVRALYRHRGHSVWGGYSRSFRAPNIADISRFGRSRSSEIEVASLDLTPERFDTFELAYSYDNQQIAFGLTAYTTELHDYIATVPTGNIREGLIEVAKRNAASGRISGVEAFFRANLGSGFAFNSNATWLRGRLTTPTVNGLLREPISRIQPITGNFTLTWERDDHWALAELTLTDRADELSSGDLLDVERIPPGGTPGYALLNIRGGTQIAKGVALTLALNNLFDETYRAHGSGNNEPGRHLVAGMNVKF